MGDARNDGEVLPARIVFEHREIVDNHFDLMVLLGKVWRRRRLVMVVTALAALVAAVVALSLPPRYAATATLLPAESESVTPSIPSSLAGLAGLVGMNASNGSNEQEALLTLRSRAFLYEFMEKYGVRQQLYAKQWDAENGKWREGGGGLVSDVLDWAASIGAPPGVGSPDSDNGPSVWRAYERFREMLDVSQDRQTREIRVTLEWADPVLAAQWVNDLVADLDTEMRRRAVAQSNSRLAFLEKKLVDEGLVSLRGAISNLVEKELTRVMLASVQGDFALRVIDPAVTPERKTKPRRAAIVFVGAVFGLFVAMLLSQILERRQPVPGSAR